MATLILQADYIRYCKTVITTCFILVWVLQFFWVCCSFNVSWLPFLACFGYYTILHPLVRHLLVNVSSRSRSLYAIARPSVVCVSSVCLSVVCLSVVCNVRTPYSGGSDFRQYFYGIRYLGHSWTSTENFTGRGTPPPGELNTRGVAKYSDFGPRRLYLGNGAR